MLIRKVSESDFSRIVREVSDSLYNGNLKVIESRDDGVRFPRVRAQLRANSSREVGARRSWSGRRTVSACWHAHRDVYREVFRQYPDATIQTSMARYTADNFENTYPRTGDQNIGSMVSPAYMPELCDCGGYE